MSKAVIAMPQMGNSLFRKYMKSKYVQSLSRSGAEVRWIELGDADSAAASALECDGLLLPGGADISPGLYGRTPEPGCGRPNPLRDEAEPLMLKAFLACGKPVLGICRGFQLINVCCSGTLFQNIKDRQSEKHMDFLSRAGDTHPVEIIRGSRLFNIFGCEQLWVNSMHHQAADKIGDGLRVTAVSPDGFAEAVELGGDGFCLAVQWHPEHMSRKSVLQQRLFDAFVREAEGFGR